MEIKRQQLARMILVFIFLLVAAAVIPSILSVNASGTDSYKITESNTRENEVQKGVTLHCWNWSYKNIEENMELIREMGFTSIQTSPVQPAKESTIGKTVEEAWWVYYQPLDFAVDDTGTSALGTKEEFESMCKKAHEYGIKVIVDVVANHMASQYANNLSNDIVDLLKNDSSCWHNIYLNTSDYSNRFEITQHCMGGLPDLNTSNKTVQNYVLDFLKECIDSGVDGFCFDSAKYIETQGDYVNKCESDFWQTVINGATFYALASKGINLYCYGEVIDQPDTSGSLYISAYTQYMSVTDNEKGEKLRDFINSGDAVNAALSNYYKETGALNLVLWAESQDSYAEGGSAYFSTNVINKTWALLAARADAMGVYLARPYNMDTKLGASDITGWANKEVAAVNNFHNAFVGETENLASEDGIAYCERGTSGIVLVNCDGNDVDVDVAVYKMKDGNYVDQITGNTFTVYKGRIRGKIGDTGIAVVYKPAREPKIYISHESGFFTTDTLEITVELSNAEMGTYQIGRGETVPFVGETKFTIDKDTYNGKSIDVKITAKFGSKETSKTFSYTKGLKSENVAYIALPEGWSEDVYCYAYDADKVALNNGNWPGVKMTFVKDDIYMYEVPTAIENPRVIFVEENGRRYPENNEQGFALRENMIFQDGEWGQYEPETISYGKVVVSHVDESGKNISELDILKGKAGEEYQTSAKNIYGYVFSKVDGNKNGKFTDDQIDIKYIYSKIKIEKTRTAYIKKPITWVNTMYCYVYSADNESIKNASWPGIEMTYVANGVYKYEVPADISNPLIIFTDNIYQYPGSMQRGLELPGDMIYVSGIWKEFSANVLSNENVAYIETGHNWGKTMYCYAYSADDGMANAQWPGIKMEHVYGNLYKYKVPTDISNPLVIFTDGNNQYPGSMKPGLPLVGHMIYQNGVWNDYK